MCPLYYYENEQKRGQINTPTYRRHEGKERRLAKEEIFCSILRGFFLKKKIFSSKELFMFILTHRKNLQGSEEDEATKKIDLKVEFYVRSCFFGRGESRGRWR